MKSGDLATGLHLLRTAIDEFRTIVTHLFLIGEGALPAAVLGAIEVFAAYGLPPAAAKTIPV